MNSFIRVNRTQDSYERIGLQSDEAIEIQARRLRVSQREVREKALAIGLVVMANSRVNSDGDIETTFLDPKTSPDYETLVVALENSTPIAFALGSFTTRLDPVVY